MEVENEECGGRGSGKVDISHMAALSIQDSTDQQQCLQAFREENSALRAENQQLKLQLEQAHAELGNQRRLLRQLEEARVGQRGAAESADSGHSNGTKPESDPEECAKRKLTQQQLVVLLHANKCQQRDKQQTKSPPGLVAPSSCTLPYCAVMKDVLVHMASCTKGRQCPYAHCASSRQILTHWKNCSNWGGCPVCSPVRSYTSSPDWNNPASFQFQPNEMKMEPRK